VEYTGGSTRPALALVCRAKGYRPLIVMADRFTEERFRLLRALGAEIDVVESVEGRPRVTAQDVANMVAVSQALRPRGVHVRALHARDSPFAMQGWAGRLDVPQWDPAAVDDTDAVGNDEAIAMTLRLARDEGIFAGVSTGANVVGALRLAERLGREAVIVTPAVDSGFKYLSVSPYEHVAAEG
jgi:cysteine synthase A